MGQTPNIAISGEYLRIGVITGKLQRWAGPIGAFDWRVHRGDLRDYEHQKRLIVVSKRLWAAFCFMKGMKRVLY